MASPGKPRSIAPEQPRPPAFSLVEVVVALGLCTFTLIALLGLFQVGLISARESEDQVQAANLATQILATRSAAPGADFTNSPIPATALTNAFSPIYSDSYVAPDGRLTPTAANAAYRISCSAGTNSMTGPRLAQVRLVLSWPARAAASNAAGRYEAITFIPVY